MGQDWPIMPPSYRETISDCRKPPLLIATVYQLRCGKCSYQPSNHSSINWICFVDGMRLLSGIGVLHAFHARYSQLPRVCMSRHQSPRWLSYTQYLFRTSVVEYGLIACLSPHFTQFICAQLLIRLISVSLPSGVHSVFASLRAPLSHAFHPLVTI